MTEERRFTGKKKWLKEPLLGLFVTKALKTAEECKFKPRVKKLKIIIFMHLNKLFFLCQFVTFLFSMSFLSFSPFFVGGRVVSMIFFPPSDYIYGGGGGGVFYNI
jgi:hypothetical protein